MGVTNIPISATTTDFIGAINAARTALGGFDRDLNTKLVSSFRALDREQKVYAQGLGRVQKELALQAKLAKEAAEAAKGPSLLSQFTGVAGLAGGLVSLGAAFNVLKQGLTIASDFQRIDTSLKAVSRSAESLAQSKSFLAGASDKYGLAIEDLSRAFVGFKANTNDTALVGAEAERIFLSVAKASAALQLSTEDTTGVLRAFGQMLSKGTVQSEELKGQVGERLYAAFQLAAKGMGVATTELNKMLQRGDVLAVDLLPKLATQIDKTFGESAINNVETMTGGWTRATNQAKLFISEFSQSSGIDTFFTKMGNGLANTIQGMRELNRLGQGGILSAIGGLGNFQKNVLAERAGQQRAEFGTLPRGQQLARLELLGEQIKNASLLEQTIFVPLLKDLKQQYQGNRRDDRRTAANAAPADTRLNIDALRKRQSALAEQIANGKLNGDNVSKLQAEYARLTAQIDNATESTKKHKVAVDSQSVGLTTNESILARLTQRYKETGQGGNTVALFKGLVAQDKLMAEMKPVNLGDSANRIIQTDRLKEALIRVVAPLQQAGGLFGRFNDVLKVNSLAYYNEQIEKLQANIEKLTTRGEAVPQSTMDDLARYKGAANQINRSVSGKNDLADIRANNLAGGDQPSVVAVQKMLDQMRAGKDAINMSVAEVAAAMAAGRQALALSGADLLSGIGDSIGKGQNPLKTALKSILTILGDFAIKLGTALLLSSAALLAAAPFSAGITLAPGIGQKIAGGLLIVGGAAVKGLAGYAKGGVFTSETVGRFGEYTGAALNPEIATPQRLMASVVRNELKDFGPRMSVAKGPTEIAISLGAMEIKGSSLYTVQQRHIVTLNDFGL